jgi:hypothetical protein
VKSLYRSALRSLGLAAGFASLATPAFAQLEPGAIVVYRVGTGAAALSTAATEVFLDVFDATGDPLGTIPMPTVASGPDMPLTAAGSVTAEGVLNLSQDCSFLTLTGYTAAPGTPAVSTTTAAAVPRVIGVVDAAGTVDTSTALGDFASTGAPRSAASTNGLDLWAVGSAGGTRYAMLGATSSVQVSNFPGNLRSVGIAGDQLYVSTQAAAGIRIGSVGTGLPTTAGQTALPLPGFPTTGLTSSFALVDLSPAEPGPDVLYVTDEGPAALTKYSLTAGTWGPNGTVGVDNDDYRGVAAVIENGNVTIVATRGGRDLVRLVDSSGHGGTLAGTPEVLETAASNTAFRSAAFAPGTPCPEPASAVAWLAAGSALLVLRRRRRAAF